jgi:UDP-glucuronate 4-epimerase
MNSKNSYCPYRILNIGGNQSVKLKTFVEILEKNLGIKSKKKYLPMQLGDVYKTQASTHWIKKNINFIPKIKIKVGIKNFLNWYFDYYKI